MAANYDAIIKKAYQDGELLDALLKLQEADGFLTEDALNALASFLNISAAEVYDAASFYSMLRFAPRARTEILVCRGTACHSGGNAKLLEAIEKATGAKPGQESPCGEYRIGFVECLGQCQAAPNMLINGKLYSGVDPEKVEYLLKEAAK